MAVEDRRLGSIERVAPGDRVGVGLLPRIGHDLLRGPLDDCPQRRVPPAVPALYALGAALPVLGFAVVFGAGSSWLARPCIARSKCSAG